MAIGLCITYISARLEQGKDCEVCHESFSQIAGLQSIAQRAVIPHSKSCADEFSFPCRSQILEQAQQWLCSQSAPNVGEAASTLAAVAYLEGLDTAQASALKA